MRNLSFINMSQGGFLKMPNDHIVKTLLVAISLCLFCSIVVSSSAVFLKPLQQYNKQLDKKKNILSVSGFDQTGQSVDELFAKIDAVTVELATGEVNKEIDAASYDARKAMKETANRVDLTTEQDIAKIGATAKYANVYLVRKDNGEISKIILPISGYGLWGTLYGFIALEGDAETVSGITFHEHKETAGLGGEVDNPKWKALWKGKKIGEGNQVLLQVIKGKVGANTSDSEYKIDGLAGASLTSNGVSNLIQFWLGDNGFEPYLNRIKQANPNLKIGS